ncbi:MAG TPA: septal ring lytic transglycosylase RlpA family protein, partial [Thermoleophilaceae bacterium]|nr:septal ring lytic transglycosylase RlpA family protein [Thermoleophilaceae bacterium]
IALSGAALAFPAVALATGGNGGTASPTPGASGPVDPSFALNARGAMYLGRTLSITGSDPSAASKVVSLEARQGSDQWVQVATAQADPSGAFAATWRPSSSGQYQLRGVVAGTAQASDASSASSPRTVVVYKAATATWYGPGFYGKRTACGQRLTRRLVGVANRHLRCGTQVQVRYRARTIVAPVVDRGPYSRHAQWDLTAAAAKRLGMTVTSRIGAAPLNLSLQPPVL